MITDSGWTPVRSKADQNPLGEGESYEDFHPTFTYPVCAPCLLSQYVDELDLRFMETMRKSMATRIYLLTQVFCQFLTI